ncbi:MAG TPA: hypothetical protein P5248_10085, partial [Bacteroidales bacterium]|nr:hypothetical protein [Bacteroidales bacterium]
RLGMRAEREGARVSIAPQPYPAGRLNISPDWSAAAFPYALVALRPGSSLDLPGLSTDSLQGDRLTAALFEPLGVKTLRTSEGIRLEHHRIPTNHPLDADLGGTPDLLPALAVTAALRGQAMHFRGIAHLRDKESDRISAVQALLQQCGCASKAGPDWLEVTGQGLPAQAGPLDPQNDHRLAMAFSLMALASPITLKDPSCTGKSWPQWWEVLRGLGFRIFTE